MTIEHVYEKNVQSLYRYAYSRLRNKEKAEDVVSEAFTRFCEDFARIRLRTMDPKIWLFAIARNILRDTYKENYTIELPIENEKLPDEEISLETQEIDNELISKLGEIVYELEPNTRDVIVMHLWEDMKFYEIAEVLEIAESTVKSRYFRGLQKIKNLLEEKGFIDKKFILSAGFILYAFTSLKYNSDLIVDFIFKRSIESQILETIRNLYFKDPTIMNTSNPISNAVPESSPANPPTAVPTQVKESPKLLYSIIAGLFAIIIIGGGIGAYLWMNKDNDNDNDDDSNSTTSTLTSTSTINSSTSTTSQTSTSSSSTVVDLYQGWKTYTNTYYNFELRYPSNWSVSDTYNVKCDQTYQEGIGGACAYVSFKNGGETLAIAVTSTSDKGEIDRTGVGAGEIENKGEVSLGSTQISKNVLVFEGKTKEVLYDNGGLINAGNNIFSISYGIENYADYSSVSLKDEGIQTADKILSSYKVIKN